MSTVGASTFHGSIHGGIVLAAPHLANGSTIVINTASSRSISKVPNFGLASVCIIRLTLLGPPAKRAHRMLPFPRNEDVVDRPAISAELDRLLPASSSESHSAALWGLGGSG